MTTPTPVGPTVIAFAGSSRIASGPIAEVAIAARRLLDADPSASVLVFDAATSQPVEIDFRGTAEDVTARLTSAPAEAPAPRGPGRPKLGVVAREVTLLPRHWEWLATQPGGASVTLRKLVEAARREGSAEENARTACDSAYRFMLAMAGNEPGFEEATRALYASDEIRFGELTEGWPADVRDHARELAKGAFIEPAVEERP